MEEAVICIEQAQPASAVIVAIRDTGGIVAETAGVQRRNLCLKFLGRLADVVQAQKEAKDGNEVFTG